MNKRIKALRKELGFTQAKFGEKLNMTNNYIYMIESGATPITDNFIFLVCTTFHVNREWLETGEGEMFTPKLREEKIAELSAMFYNMDGLSDEDEAQLIELIKVVVDLSPRQQELLLEIANEFADKEKKPS